MDGKHNPSAYAKTGCQVLKKGRRNETWVFDEQDTSKNIQMCLKVTVEKERDFSPANGK